MPYSLLEFEVIRLLEDSADAGDACPKILRRICTSLGWSLGEIWLVDPDTRTMSLASVWHTDEGDFDEFVEITRGIRADMSRGLPGRMFALQRPMFIPDLMAEPDLLRRDEASRAHLKAGLAFPLTADRNIIGALVLLGFEAPFEMDEPLEKALAALGAHIGRFLATDVALHRSPAYYQAIVENQCDIVSLIGLDGTIHYENSAVERILGFGRRERIGKNIYDFVHPRDTAGVRAAFQAGLENPGIVQTLLVRVSRNDGSWVHLEATGRMMVDIAGTHVAVVNSRAVTADRTAVREPVVSPALSERQVAVLRLVGQGMTNKQIAGELNVSPHTVKDNLKDAMRKLGQRNRAATVLAATQQGLL